MYTIQSPSGITIVMDAAFYLCAIRVTIFFSLVIESSDFMSAGIFSQEKVGEQKRIIYKEIRMKQRTTNVHWLSQYRKSNPPIKIIKLFTNITTNPRTFAIFLRQGRSSADSSCHASLAVSAERWQQLISHGRRDPIKGIINRSYNRTGKI